jgi:hypothetical protein
VYIQYVDQGYHQIYGHIQYVYMVLANPSKGIHMYLYQQRVCPSWAWTPIANAPRGYR